MAEAADRHRHYECDGDDGDGDDADDGDDDDDGDGDSDEMMIVRTAMARHDLRTSSICSRNDPPCLIGCNVTGSTNGYQPCTAAVSAAATSYSGTSTTCSPAAAQSQERISLDSTE